MFDFVDDIEQLFEDELLIDKLMEKSDKDELILTEENSNDPCPTRTERKSKSYGNPETKDSIDAASSTRGEDQDVVNEREESCVNNEATNLPRSKNNNKSYWKESERTASNDEIKVLVAEMLSVITAVLMNIVYSFAGKIYLHKGKGSMGDRAMGIIAAIVMIWWAKKLKLKFEELKIGNDLLKIYVDDVNGVYETIEAGIEYIDGKLKYNEEKVESDKNIPDDAKTLSIVKSIANDIDGMIQMTNDVPSNHDDKIVPILDMKVWI